MHKEQIRFLWMYLRAKRRGLAGAVLSLALFCGTFALYRVPFSMVLYPMLLSVLLLGLFAFFDLLRQWKRHCSMRDALREKEFSLELLPAPEHPGEKDYAALLELCASDRRSETAREERRRQEMIDYYATWAHQVKTPIAAMRLALQREDSALSRRLSADLDRVEQYVGMVMAYQRLEGENGDYVFTRFDLDEMLKKCLRRFTASFLDKHIALDFRLTGQTVLSDEKWLSFVAEQLLSNALKYTAAGSVRVAWEQEGLIVEDTGMGIDPADLPRIFERGYTGISGRLDHRASGLGLFLCKQICDRLGHRISVTSQVGKGTRVTLGLTRREYPTE